MKVSRLSNGENGVIVLYATVKVPALPAKVPVRLAAISASLVKVRAAAIPVKVRAATKWINN